MYEVITGQLQFSGASNEQVMDMQVNQPVPNVLDLQPDLPNAWQEIIVKAMAKSPDGRYTSAGEFAQDVQDLVSGRWFWRKL